jgi:homogentisate 1,2-dioxygenase
MTERFFYNADGELLVVPQSAPLEFRTECGVLDVAPGEIVVIPRGLKFQVRLPAGPAAGYVLEAYGKPFELPYLGPIGANGLANPRDFQAPVAAYEDKKGNFSLVAKFCGELWECPLGHSPLDVVAWHGNYAPYKYDLRLFNTIGTVSFDHPDPSIFTVLTSPTDREGIADVDFVIFPARWMVATDTFRPPYFHRNVMSEFMGLIYGVYDAKPAGGFHPGGSSLHNCMSPHGPEQAAFAKAIKDKLEPSYLADTLAFMFESSWVYQPTRYALESAALQADYWTVWRGIEPTFKP